MNSGRSSISKLLPAAFTLLNGKDANAPCSSEHGALLLRIVEWHCTGGRQYARYVSSKPISSGTLTGLIKY